MAEVAIAARRFAPLLLAVEESIGGGMAELGGVRGAGCTGYRGSRAERTQVEGLRDASGLRRCGVDRSLGRVGELRAMAVEFPVVHGHPNRLPFEGVLTLVDVPSDKAPSGSRGHRVVLTREAAEAALPSLLGMAVDYKAGWDGHDARQKCGIITAAEVDGKRLMVAGYLFAKDFPEFGPELESKLQGGAMGMSYELADAHVADMRASIWTLTKATFTGAAILLRDKAAYRNTSFRVQRGGLHAAAASVRQRAGWVA